MSLSCCSSSQGNSSNSSSSSSSNICNAEFLAELAAAGGVPELAHLMANQAQQQQQ
jgi:hypothetical protein